MYSFLESSLFDSISDDRPGQVHQTQSANGGAQNAAGTSFTQRQQEASSSIPGPSANGLQDAKVYGTPNQAAAAVPAGPIQCRDKDAVAALESVIKAQVMAEKRIITMETKVLGLLEQLNVAQNANRSPKTGLSNSGMIGIAVVIAVCFVFFFFVQSRRKTPPMEFVMRQAVPSMVTGTGAPLTPVVIGPSLAPQTFM